LVADVPVADLNPLHRHLGDWIGWLSLAGMTLFAVAGSVAGCGSKSLQKP
jgi:hypothetical protein